MSTFKVSFKDGDDVLHLDAADYLETTDLPLAEGKIMIGNAQGLASALDLGNTDAGIAVGNGTTATIVALSGDVTMDNAGAVTIANDAVTEAKVADSAGVAGLFIQKTAVAVYDFAVDGGEIGAIVLDDAATLPDNAVITGFNYDVITTCQSAGADAGTMVLSLPTDGAFSTAVAISDGSNPLDAGFHFGSTLTPLVKKTTAARKIGVTIAEQAFTAGKVVFFVDYMVSQ